MTGFNGALSDEILMAYADGMLDPDALLEVERKLSTDPDARERLAVFKRSARILGEVFDQPMREPVPNRLLETLDTGPVPPGTAGKKERFAKETARRTINRGNFKPRSKRLVRNSRSSGKWFSAAGFAATAAALVVMFFALRLSEMETLDRPSSVVARDQVVLKGPQFSRFLETASMRRSMKFLSKDNNLQQGKIVQTFLSRNGEFCRHYELTQATSSSVSGVACRDSIGAWTVRFQLPKNQLQHVVSDEPSGSGGSMPGASQLRIDQVVDEMIDGEPLSLEDETLLLQGNWRLND